MELWELIIPVIAFIIIMVFIWHRGD